ncbi:MAG: DNA polymerase III subunit alpha [Porticoccaceae bacterium]|nr:DNA polymerase III subunit alpha [Pseudomonadales bacterium]MCP5171901.1 DNA polymerase III subunit alpha [Pseudomonadales bacterium]
MEPSFVHLRLHSEYSLVDGMVRVKPLVERAASLGMPAVAITDVCNFYALVKFYKAAQQVGIKPVCGSDLLVENPLPDALPSGVTLLVQNGAGYKNLTTLISRAYLEGQVQGKPLVQRQWLAENAEGLLILLGRESDVGQALLSGRQEQASELLQFWAEHFPERLYLMLCRTGRDEEEDYLHAAVSLAEINNCPVVATNDVRFLDAEQFEAHEARVCIREGRALDDPRRERRYSDQQYFRSVEEMTDLFSDIPEALQNSVEIAKRCNLELSLGNYFLPEYPIPEGMTINGFFEQVSQEGLEKRLSVILDSDADDYAERRKPYDERLRFELDIIIQMGFPGYFLIVMDFIRWAKQNDIPVGPGRGSGAGSLVAYALEITDLDPLAYDLLFERFLNPERVSMPDFDIDFCMDNRDRVIAYVSERYGREAVSQIITFGTMAAKAVVRDVARVQGKSYGLADKLSKMIPPDIGMTLEKALQQEERLKEFLDSDEEAQGIWEMALQLEGITRNVGKHAGGVVIAPTRLTDFSPLYCDEAGEGLVTQFDKDDVEQAGLVKFDFLGLRTLTIIDWAVAMVNQYRQVQGEEPITIESIPLDDVLTYGLMKRAETTAVFQLESRGMKDLIKRVEPGCFEDIVALVALFRPGPLQSGMVDDFINRKHGRAELAYPHPKYQHETLKPVLEPTYGIILYQEQVMQIAQVMGGYTLGGADLLRRAMGKKKPEEMAKQRELFMAGAEKQGFEKELASNIFDLMEKFAGYGFNKSHSAAYALLAYQTAWLKAHYPSQFMAAVMSADMQNTDKVVTLVDECHNLSLPLLPPDVNRGEFSFTVSDKGEVIYGLGAIKGLGEGPVESIIAARQSGGAFKDLFDFCARVDARKVNKRALEALIRSGALDEIGPDGEIGYRRAVMLAAMEEAVKLAEQHTRNTNSGMSDLFGASVVESAPEVGYQSFRSIRAFKAKERLSGEKDTLGLYLTGHPVDEYAEELTHFVGGRIVDLKPSREGQLVAGLVVGMRTMKNKRGDNMAFLVVDDRSGRIEVAVFAEAFNEHREKIAKDALLVIEGVVSEDDYSGGLKMRAMQVKTLHEARTTYLKSISVKVSATQLNGNGVDQLVETVMPYRTGQCPLRVVYNQGQAVGEIALGKDWAVNPEDELLHRLREQYGINSVELNFR